MIRCSREKSRACNCCGSRTKVLTLALGAEHIRICDPCFVDQLDSIEVA